MSKISKKKIQYPVSPDLSRYLKKYGREVKLRVSYDHLLRYTDSIPLGDTLWVSVIYSQEDLKELNKSLCYIYALLKTDGNISVIEHLYVDRIDYCLFGNSNPFRIRIVNNYNDNYDYFYVKKADASRIYGLELEDVLSPNRITYFVDKETLIEEHITGIPGDDFIKKELHQKHHNKTRLAKEFVKFNERCFIRLLGDMRSYNFVVEVTHDFDDVQYRIRAIDFDQQSYEGRKSLYLPQYFKENKAFVDMAKEVMAEQTVKQYQHEERSRMARRIKYSRYVVKDLYDVMSKEKLSTDEKIEQLKHELAIHYREKAFFKCKTMGEILRENMKTLRNHF